jgi:hypothetical protein
VAPSSPKISRLFTGKYCDSNSCRGYIPMLTSGVDCADGITPSTASLLKPCACVYGAGLGNPALTP